MKNSKIEVHSPLTKILSSVSGKDQRNAKLINSDLADDSRVTRIIIVDTITAERYTNDYSSKKKKERKKRKEVDKFPRWNAKALPNC